MQTKIKRILATALSLIMMVGVLGSAIASADNSYEAKLGYANSDWSAQEWGDNAKTTVTGEGNYSVSWDGAGTDALVFVIDIVGANEAFAAAGLGLTALEVLVDGNPIAVDLSKIVTGDLEDNGNFRIEIYNEYGSTKADPGIDPAAVSFATNLTVNFTLGVKETAGYTAKLGYANSDWSAQEWGDNAYTTVTTNGSYSISWDGAGTDALVFVIDIVGAEADLLAAGEELTVTALEVLVDGNPIAVDLSKIVVGDLEDNGNIRIEIYNEYGNTKADPPVDPAAVSFATNLTINFTVATVAAAPDVDEPVDEPDAPAAVFDPAGSYNAYLLLQTPNWTYRDPWNSANGIGSDYWGNFIYGNETSQTYGTVTDAVVAGNGTYSITITDFGTIFEDDFATAGQDYFNILGVSTDIPLSDDIVITDVKVIVDGKTRHTDASAFLDPDDTEYVKILIVNIWNPDKNEISYYPAPTESLEIQFTISGFNYDKAGSEEAPTTDGTTDTETPAAEEPAGNTGLIIAIVAAVVVVGVVVFVVIKKKKA